MTAAPDRFGSPDESSCPRRLYCTACVAALMMLWILSGSVRAQDGDGVQTRPNIVLIMADDMGYECMGANGSTTYQTPHLDELARTGMRFVNAHSQPICTPSRVQIMTGIYNHRNYVRFGVLDPEAVTFAQVLRDAGYATCVAGKWQLAGGLEAPHAFGFDEYCLWQVSRRPGRYPNPGLEINRRELDYDDGEYGPDLVSDYLCDFMKRHQDQPFLVYYPMILPHWPFEPTPDSPEWDPTAEGVLNGHGKNEFFDDMVAYADKVVGKLVRQLEELDLRERTLIIFTGDNGTYTGITSYLGSRAVRGGKGTTLDTGTHVPFVVNWPGTVSEGVVAEELVDFSDLFPTLVETAGATVPSHVRLDGRSFLPLLRGEEYEPRSWIYGWYERNGRREEASQWVRDARFKLYADGRFIDVREDPNEQRPIETDDLTEDQRRARDRLAPVLDEYAAEAAAADERLLERRSQLQR